jgi:hypothetical protein
LCELDDNKVYQSLADNTLIVYIRAHEDNESALIERARTRRNPPNSGLPTLPKKLDTEDRLSKVI